MKYLIREINPNQAKKTLKGSKINPARTKRDKEGLGIKYTKLSLNFLGANCRSINNKHACVADILDMKVVDIGFFPNLTQKKPKFKGFTSFVKYQNVDSTA